MQKKKQLRSYNVRKETQKIFTQVLGNCTAIMSAANTWGNYVLTANVLQLLHLNLELTIKINELSKDKQIISL